jgi:hypothetical protein
LLFSNEARASCSPILDQLKRIGLAFGHPFRIHDRSLDAADATQTSYLPLATVISA